MIQRELCGTCLHGSHNAGPCKTVSIDGPPSTGAPRPGDLHPGRTTTPCDCKVSTPYRNGKEAQ